MILLFCDIYNESTTGLYWSVW